MGAVADWRRVRRLGRYLVRDRRRLLVALLLSLLTGGALFAQLERLMQQVEEGKFKAVDFDNFDEFF